MKDNTWFHVDPKGLAATIEQPERCPLELYQNAVDEKISRIDIVLQPNGKRGIAELVATDDSPNGYEDLTESYTLYAPSKKRGDATKRGRMNVGEKRVLSLCEEATITSTTGTVSFRPDGTRVRNAASRPFGTEFKALIRLKKPEIANAIRLLQSVLPPKGIEVTINGQSVDGREPIHVFKETLQTVLPDEDGRLTRNSKRQTEIHLHEPRPGEVPTLFEMGIPVVELTDRWHVDIQQRVPLNTERDNITPAYLRHLRTLVLNEMHERITTEDANATWAKEALSDERVTEEAVRSVVEKRFGEKVVSYDPSDIEANNRAVAEGYTVVHGRSLAASEWSNVRRAQAILPAGRVTPSESKLFQNQLADMGGEKSAVVPEEKWTDAQRKIVEYTKKVGLELLGFEPEVAIASDITLNALAWWGGRTITFNTGRLGHRWFDEPRQEAVDALLLHEFAHNAAANHLDHSFHDEMGKLGARLRNISLRLDSVMAPSGR